MQAAWEPSASNDIDVDPLVLVSVEVVVALSREMIIVIYLMQDLEPLVDNI